VNFGYGNSGAVETTNTTCNSEPVPLANSTAASTAGYASSEASVATSIFFGNIGFRLSR
jgi:hypothetical protein